MSNVFISHSSTDKPLVKRVALGLMAEGIPVWLDIWNLEVGDSLVDKIYEGIDGSSFVILVISQNANESGWVNRELNAALSKEQQIGRKFLIPIRIDNCVIPLKIADRLYADFSKPGTFSEPLSKLAKVLVANGCRNLPVAREKELLGLSFTQAVNLDITSLQRAINHIRQRHHNFAPNSTQIVINDDKEYEVLLSKMHSNIDKIAYNQLSKPDGDYLRGMLEKIEQLQAWLTEGIAAILSNNLDMDAAYWFAKIVRGQLVHNLWSSQRRDDPECLDYGRAWSHARLLSNESAARFFETDKVEIVDIWNESSSGGEYFHMWIGSEECAGLRLDGAYIGPRAYYDSCLTIHVNKYVFPQMVLEFLANPKKTGQPIWDLGKAVIGLS